MSNDQPRSGYTLPVFACAAAIAALRWLRDSTASTSVEIDLIEPTETVEIPIEQVAGLKDGMALAITRSDPGDNLDLTRNTPIWALVEWLEGADKEDKADKGEEIQSKILIRGGEGIGKQGEGGEAAIYAYAQKLLQKNLGRLLEVEENIQVTIILPEGRQLAERTSNTAFGVVEGLSLLGTTGISQPLSAAGQLDIFRDELKEKISLLTLKESLLKQDNEEFISPLSSLSPISHTPPALVFCVGENGLDLAQQMGIAPERLVKTANWLGPLLVEAGLQGVKEILLFGYHGKLMKLAGGIFHTHHHLADGRLEILTSYCAQVGLRTLLLQKIFNSPTAEAALKYLRDLDTSTGNNWTEQVYGEIAQAIDTRSQAYIRTHSEQDVRVGSIMFDRERQIIVKSKIGTQLLYQMC